MKRSIETLRRLLLPACAALGLLVVACQAPGPAPLSVGEGRWGELSLPDRGGATTYQWTQMEQDGVPQVAIDRADERDARFIAPEGKSDYPLQFVRVALKSGHELRSERLDVVVIADNDPPEATAGESRQVTEGQLVTLFGAGKDRDSRDLVYQWEQPEGRPVVELTGADTPTPTFQAPDVEAQTNLVFVLRVSDESSTTHATVTIGVAPVNAVPVADAGVDQEVLEGQRVTLNGLARDDDEESSVRLRWRIVTQEPFVTLDDVEVRQPTFVAPACPNPLEPYKLEFELTADDGHVESEPDRVVVTVKPINDSPEASVGGDFEVKEGDEVVLRGAGSDPEGQELEFLWSQVEDDTVHLFGADQAEARFDAPAVPEGDDFVVARFQLKVFDGEHYSAPATLAVTIRPERRRLGPLAPGEIEYLFGEKGEDFLDRWINLTLSSDQTLWNLVDRRRSLTIEAESDPPIHYSCEMRPGSWRLEGALELISAEEKGEQAWGGVLRFETEAGRAVEVGLVSVRGETSLQTSELERSRTSEEWSLVRSTQNKRKRWPLKTPLHLAATWQDGALRLQWADSDAELLDRPQVHLELPAPPHVMTLVVRRAKARYEQLRLVGV